MTAPAAILIAARDEETCIGGLVRRLATAFPGSPIVVGDDGSRDRTAAEAAAAGALVVSGPRLGKGEALNAAARAAPPGSLLLCDADVEGDLAPLVAAGADLAVARFARRVGGGFGVAKGAARALVRALGGVDLAEPLSGQRYLSPRARAACFPLARGFGCEVRMTLDALRAGLRVAEVELPLAHRATGRDAAGFAHRGRQLADALLAAGPLAVNYRGNRLPIVGPAVALGGLRAPRPAALAVAAVVGAGLADDLFSGPERGFRAHLEAGQTTGVAKLVAIPLAGLVATRSVSGALLVGLAANAANQLDTRPGRLLKAFLLVGPLVLPRPLRGYLGLAVLLLPYDLRERGMLGDAGANGLGAVVGLGLVARLTGSGRWTAVAVLGGLNALGERTSLGRLVERTRGLSLLDRAGRVTP